MNKIKNTILILLMAMLTMGCTHRKEPAQKPNIIVFLADDLGYGETGVYGQQKIQTPHIDALAESGMMFTQHYSGAPVCAPSRCVVLTGRHTGHAYIRGNDEWTERGDVWNYEKASSNPALEGQRPIPDRITTIAEVLKKTGYVTGIFGKWGLGAPGTEGVPNAQGFDYFYGYNCQRQAHNLYPPHLWENTEKDILDNEMVIPHVKMDASADQYKESSYANYTGKTYAPAKIHQKALTFIKESADHPFFMYYASPLPHVPLQAPEEFVDEYLEIFGDETPYPGNNGYFPCRYPRATYAAMIAYLDHQLGELIETLKRQGVYENTIVFFTSDNGPTYTGGVDFDFFESAKPFSNGYGRTKGYVYEGGIRVPMIVSWAGRIKAGTVSHHVSAFYDLMPTICELAHAAPPEKTDGISFMPELMGEYQKPHDFLYWEFPGYNGQQAVRTGNWKGVRKNIFDGNLTIELYNLETDIKEQSDVSEQHPDIVQRIEDIMTQEHEPSEIDKFKFEELGDR